jgi:hypothetical protein
VESAQYNWLEDQLSSPVAQNAEWLFVLGHVPIYSVGTNNNFELNRDVLLPLLLEYGVDIFFAGHIHDYERGYSEGLYHIISAGGGGPLSHHVRNLPEITEYSANYHFCMINVNGSLLRFHIKDRNQNIIDQFSINKNPDSISDKDLVNPNQLALHNYPNPFNASTMIQFSVPIESDYSIKIYSISGLLVKVLAEGFAQAGTYWLPWNGDDSNGMLVSSGVYTCHILTNSGSNQTKLIYVK